MSVWSPSLRGPPLEVSARFLRFGPVEADLDGPRARRGMVWRLAARSWRRCCSLVRASATARLADPRQGFRGTRDPKGRSSRRHPTPIGPAAAGTCLSDADRPDGLPTRRSSWGRAPPTVAGCGCRRSGCRSAPILVDDARNIAAAGAAGQCHRASWLVKPHRAAIVAPAAGTPPE